MGGQKAGGQSDTYSTVVVDDDPLFRDWLRSSLEEGGDFRVLGEACNGAECIDLVHRVTPDVVILDLHMPDRDGLELAAYIKWHFPATRTIVTSSDDAPVYSRLARQQGVLAFIPKATLSVSALRQSLQAEPVP